MADEIIVVLISVVVGGVVTFLITKHFKQKKSLAYQIVSKMSLINVNPEVRDKIKIDYDGTPVENIYSFKVRIINDGNVPIKNQPILFQFDKEAKVLVADYNTKPEREFGEIKRENADVPNEVKFVIGLLNPKRMKEEIEFDFITVDNKSDNLEAISKGENLTFHEVLKPDVRFLRIYVIFTALVGMVAIALVVYSMLFFPKSEYSKMAVVVVVSVGIMLAAIGSMLARREGSKSLPE